MELFTGLFILFMIIGALFALETKDLLSSVISVGAIGFGLSIIFLFLGAPDIAITQIVVEVLVLIILIRATISRDTVTTAEEREFFGLLVTIVMLFLVFIYGMKALEGLSPFGIPAMDRILEAPSRTYIAQGLSQTGAANLVTAVILDFRAYDTLGEATVLFAAILGALAILRKKARKKIKEEGEGGKESG